jgi:hypothetical protein
MTNLRFIFVCIVVLFDSGRPPIMGAFLCRKKKLRKKLRNEETCVNCAMYQSQNTQKWRSTAIT